ncbi:flippase, partial [Pseudomonas aeruginosa]
FILSAYLFSSSWGVSSIAVSMAISFFFIFAWKISAYFSFVKDANN